MVYLTRVEYFNAAHKLYNPDWSDEKNLTEFGKCSNPNCHGHNYELHVTIKGEVNKETGYIFNAKTLGTIVQNEVLEKIDHKNLNLDVPFMKNIMPSAENIAIAIWNQIADKIKEKGGQLHCIKLYETKKIYVEYYGN